MAQSLIIPQQLPRVRRTGRIPGHGGSEGLRHLLQPADVPAPRLVQTRGQSLIWCGSLTTNCCMSTSSFSEPTPE
ncbi:hypothetical protein CEXT_170851 [Caerostris extrusa]|uniref:Uncharacterized protein n=1 Tax=Caerostris extrusa TaxID=172846 RepID=A0AAV4XWY4_CAEEX|nr:hypothetical protein CEXT_170851 [Caerostris extrusa]